MRLFYVILLVGFAGAFIVYMLAARSGIENSVNVECRSPTEAQIENSTTRLVGPSQPEVSCASPQLSTDPPVGIDSKPAKLTAADYVLLGRAAKLFDGNVRDLETRARADKMQRLRLVVAAEKIKVDAIREKQLALAAVIHKDHLKAGLYEQYSVTTDGEVFAARMAPRIPGEHVTSGQFFVADTGTYVQRITRIMPGENPDFDSISYDLQDARRIAFSNIMQVFDE